MIAIKSATKLLLTSLLLTTPLQANADYKINIDEGITIIAVNGKTILSDSLFSKNSSITLKKGTNQILVSYTAEIKAGSDVELEATQPDVILFENNNNDTITLSAPKIKTLRDLNQFKKERNWSLKSPSSKSIPYTLNTLKRDGFQLSRDYERELQDFNSSNNTAALPTQKISIHQAQAQKSDMSNNNKNMEMNMLIYWYNHADQKTRNAFKELIKSN